MKKKKKPKEGRGVVDWLKKKREEQYKDWILWREGLSKDDDYLPPRQKDKKREKPPHQKEKK